MAKKKEEPKKINFPEEYYVLGADLSLTRPGFALIHMKKGKVELVKVGNLNNKGKKKSHGQILDELDKFFCHVFMEDIENLMPIYFVREKEIMHMKVPSERNVTKVVGQMDWLAYSLWKMISDESKFDGTWHEIYPVTVKKNITGYGKSQKEDVANCLAKFVGKHEYECDDESDATAVAIAWLIQEGQIEGELDG